MSTDKVYGHLADQVYEVDGKKNPTPWKTGDEIKFDGKNYQILKAIDNSTNGMQAMAVAPVVNG